MRKQKTPTALLYATENSRRKTGILSISQNPGKPRACLLACLKNI